MTEASLRSPVTGAPLVTDGSWALREPDGRLWPVVDGIPYLRAGRDDLVARVLALLDAGDRTGALIELLGDRDDWWTGAKPDPDALRRLIAERDSLNLRDAMDLLAYDRVGTYFAHRWSDPTYLAGLALLEAHWRPTATAFELACGIGHYLRDLVRRGVAVAGGDVVFSKLWLARHWVVGPDAALVCFDAGHPWPVADRRFDLAFCHDAFYFIEPKPAILAQLRRMAERLAISHIHNAGAENLSAGRAVSPDAMSVLFPDALVYDDAELTRALAEARPPRPAPLATLASVEAFSLVEPAGASRPLDGGLALPPASARLRHNPLYTRDAETLVIRWPSPRYEAEYGPRAAYPLRTTDEQIEADRGSAVRCRTLVDLPERW